MGSTFTWPRLFRFVGGPTRFRLQPWVVKAKRGAEGGRARHGSGTTGPRVRGRRNYKEKTSTKGQEGCRRQCQRIPARRVRPPGPAAGSPPAASGVSRPSSSAPTLPHPPVTSAGAAILERRRRRLRFGARAVSGAPAARRKAPLSCSADARPARFALTCLLMTAPGPAADGRRPGVRI